MGRPKQPVAAVCQQCDRPFTSTPSLVAKGGGKYCSRDCFYQSQVGRDRSDESPKYAPSAKTCVACGQVFMVGGRGNPPRIQRLCSDACQRAARYRRGAQCAKLSAPDAAYIAGFIDGEGSIILYFRRDVVAMRVSVANTHRGVLEWIAQITGGIGVVLNGRKASDVNKQTWQWQCNADAAESLLQQIRPYLKVKSEQADLALETQGRLRDPASKIDRLWQAEWREKMKHMNARGPRPTVGASIS